MQPKVITADEALAAAWKSALGRYAVKAALVDWSAPDAERAVARLRREGCVVVVACGLEPRAVSAALAAGADDVVARGPAAARALDRWRKDDERLRVSAERHEALVRRGKKWLRLDLTRTEVRLLELLTARRGEVLSRAYLMEELGGEAVEKHAQSLRRKLGPLGRRLVTVRRAGYAWR